MSIYLSVDEIKCRFTIYEAWKTLGYPIPDRWKGCLSPWRQERKPSFSVFNNGYAFNDFSTGEGGDVIRFWSLSRGISDTEALKEIRNQVDGLSAVYTAREHKAPSTKSRDTKKVLFPKGMRTLNPEDYQYYATIRKIDQKTFYVLSHLDFNEEAYTRILYGVHRRQPSLFLIEKCGEVINTACRRLDGKPYLTHTGGVKELCLAGSTRNLPLGNSYLSSTIDVPVMLCEGTPDYLTAWHVILRNKTKGEDLPAVPLGILGASNSIHSLTMEQLAGRRVRIFPHIDPSGQGETAMQRWGNDLHHLGCKIDVFDFSSYIQANGKQVVDLNDLLFMSKEGKRNLTEIIPR